MDKDEKIIELAKMTCTQLESIHAFVNKHAIPDQFLDYFLLSLRDESNIMSKLRAEAEKTPDESIYQLETMSKMQRNILNKMKFAESQAFLNEKKQLMVAKFNTFDLSMMQQQQNDKNLEEFVRKQNVYYPQLLGNESKLGVTDFKLADPDAFNSIFDK